MVTDTISVVNLGNDLFLLSRLGDCFLYSAQNGIAMEVYEGGEKVLEDYFSGEKINLEVEAILRSNGFLEHRYIPPLEKEYLPTNIVFSVTSDCNLRCIYCYARAGLDSYVMTPGLAKAAIDVVIQNAKNKGEKKIHIGFLGGGETMLEYDLVKFIVEYVKTHWDNEISYSMVTNATLLDKEKSDYLASNDFKMTVSLDGPKEVHDNQRPMISGRGSYDACIRGIRNLKRSGCKNVGIRSTITKNNIHLLKDMLDIAKDLNVGLKVEPITPTGKGEGSSDVISANEFIHEYQEAKEYAKKLGVVLKSTYDNDFNPRSNYCSGNGRSFCVLPQGEITSCSRVTRKDDLLAEQYIIGQLTESSLKIDQEKVSFLQALSPSNFVQCVDCFAKWYCAGGCHATRLSNNGFMPEDHCVISKHFLFENIKGKFTKGGEKDEQAFR